MTLNFLLKMNDTILRSMTQFHHILVIGLVAYLIRYCTGACYTQTGVPITCITSPVNAALNQTISATNTCGNPPEGYCYIGPERQCKICDQNNPSLSHPASAMVDKFSLTDVTYWQSQTWWTTNQLGLSKLFVPLKVNITLTLKKKYLISGGVYVTFKTERPKKMIIERSNDFGNTWQVYQYYAKNCRSAYDLLPDPAINPLSPFKQICSQLYSGEFPRGGGVVHFDPRTRYQPTDYFNADVHSYLEATAIRLRLEYPGTEGREFVNEETTLNQYYYAITDLRVDARCDCNGHAEYCDLTGTHEICDCKHYTMGDDCEGCLPMYSNRVWMAGNMTHANPCEKCECFDHAFSCVYSTFLQQGICTNCIHMTRGVRCDQCVTGFYKNISVPLNHQNVCIPCDCYQPGITDEGFCLQTATQQQVLGQCNCKIGIYGRRCDQCIPGKWGFVNPPIGSCFDCNCNIYGTLNNNQICDQYTGQCICKPHTTGRSCNTCKPGYYLFPSSMSSDCIPCPCNVGGALPSCNPVNGLCTCKTGITGVKCDRTQPGYFFPNFTYIKFEPEFSSPNGTYSWHFLVRNYARFFTGLGFARLDPGERISFKFTVPTSAKFFMLCRYSLYNIDWYSSILPQGRELVDWSGSTNMQHYLKLDDRPNQWLFTLLIKDASGQIVKSTSIAMADLLLGDDKSWISSSYVDLQSGVDYTMSFVYEESSLLYGQPWPLLLDSFILMLDYNWASYFSSSSISGETRTEVKGCFQASRPLATTYNLPAFCGPHTFTIDTQLYDRVLACNCFQPGSFIWNSCASYGGQCQCKAGYGGRRCDQCIPGYYGNPANGCTRCGCSVAGSLSNACNHVTGQCLCKANAHGLKCDECLHGYFHLSEINPKGCQSCFGYGHLISCRAAMGFVRSYVSSYFAGASSFDGWKLLNPINVDTTNLLIKTSVGMEYTDERNIRYFFSAPSKYLGDCLTAYGQLLVVEMNLSPIFDRPATNVQWHVRLFGGNQVAQFKFLEEISKSRSRYTVRLHQDYMLNTTKLSEFNFKAMLGQLTAVQIGVVYFEAPVTITIKSVSLETGTFMPSDTSTVRLHYVEHATCLIGYKGLSCEFCDIGYTRVIPNGGPLINCVPCECHNRSTVCEQQSGVCSNCKPGTQGSYCEKCLEHVMEPTCDRCMTGYWGLFTQANGCKACNCFLPGTVNGVSSICNSFSGQCVCNNSLNVGGRQCNMCKENAYNISLGENLRCQECPVCYGLIENSILQVRRDIFNVQVEIATVMFTLSSAQILPFFQAITSMQSSLRNLTARANQGKITLSGLDFLWQTLDDKIGLFIMTLNGSTAIKMANLLKEANMIFSIHNSTVYQHYNIYRMLINHYNLLNNTVRARMLQQMVALHQLNNLAIEMSKYVTIATTYADEFLRNKYDLLQKIQLSISAARQAADMALIIRNRAFNLTQTLTPVYTRALEVKIYADTCIVSIETWLTQATETLVYARQVLASIEISIPDHTVNITELRVNTTSLSNQYKDYTTQLFLLSNNINAVALEITKLKTSLLHTQISSVVRRSSLYLANLLILKNRTESAVVNALTVRTQAFAMYDTVRNFMTVAAEAQGAANKALLQVDRVRTSVELALTTALYISSQIQGPKITGGTALQVMSTANIITMDEKRMIDMLYQHAIILQTQTASAKLLVQGAEIQLYIERNLTPLVTQCTNYRTLSDAAYTSAQSALSKAQQAHFSAFTAAQKITALSTNIDSLQTFNTAQLQNLLLSIERVRASYIALGLTSQITRLREAYTVQVNNIILYKAKNLALRARLDSFRLIYRSLIIMTC